VNGSRAPIRLNAQRDRSLGQGDSAPDERVRTALMTLGERLILSPSPSTVSNEDGATPEDLSSTPEVLKQCKELIEAVSKLRGEKSNE